MIDNIIANSSIDVKIYRIKRKEIIKAQKEDLKVLTNTLTKAFENDPLINWTVKNDSKKYQRMEEMHRVTVKAFGLRFGETYTNTDKTGCAVWIPPGKHNPNSFFNILLLPAWIKVVGIDRVAKIMKDIKVVEDKHPGKNYYYLMSLGVIPEMQGKNLGSKLLKPVLDKCDNENIPACLETSNPRNLNFYKKHGFEVKHEIQLPFDGPKTWIMTREPQKLTV